MALHFFTRLELADFLISRRSTGRPSKLAKRLGISERTLYDFLEMMKDLGAPICYCKQSESYYYKEKGCFHVRFRKQVSAESAYARPESQNVSFHFADIYMKPEND